MDTNKTIPKISIIIPVFNVEKYLPKCLDSVLNQSLKDIEIICVNDGSTDRSLDILMQYAQKDRRVVVIDQSNRGAGAARNKGIAIAKGEFIAFVDSDDAISNEMYSRLYTKGKQEHSDMVLNAQVKLSNGKIHYFTDASTMYLMEERPFTIKDFPVILNSCFLWNRIYRREFIVENQFLIPEGRRFAEDLLFCTQTSACAKSISCISEPYYIYNIREGSLTDSLNKSKDKSDYVKAIAETKTFLKSIGKYEYCKKDFLTFCMNIAFPLLNNIKTRYDSKNFFKGLCTVLDEDDYKTLKDVPISKEFPYIFDALSTNKWCYYWRRRG